MHTVEMVVTLVQETVAFLMTGQTHGHAMRVNAIYHPIIQTTADSLVTATGPKRPLA